MPLHGIGIDDGIATISRRHCS